MHMATKVIQWNEGTGNITLTYTGEGDGTIVVSSDQNNLSVARSQQITVKTTDGSKSQTVTISQAAGVRNYLKFTALESGTFTLTIPANVNATHLASISYSLDNGATWVTTQNTSSAVTINTPTVAEGGTVLWKGSGTQMATSTSVCSNFSSTGSFQASGNIMSLFYQDTFENELELTKTYCFCRLFYNCSTIVSMPQLSATTLTQNCYREMFYGCTSLTETTELYSINTYNNSYESMFKGCTSLVIAPKIKARTFYSSSCREMFSGCTSLTTMPEFVPETMAQGNTYQLFAMFKGCTSLVNAPSLPATTVTNSCYREMFYGCKSLTNISSLPATTLDTACYQSMFERCTSLVNTPTLPAITLASSCYRGMFYGCTSLKNVTELPALTLTVQCYYDMFNGCSSLTYIKCLATDISASNCIVNWVRSVPANVGTFVKNPEMLSWSTGVSGIPSGWTVEDADD